KSDISSSSQGLVEKEVLGPMLLEEELINSSFYTILHVGDHNEFVRNLLPKSLVNGVLWPQESGRRNTQTFNCRMLKRPPDEADSENLEAWQQYEIMQCLTISQPRPVQEDGEGTSCCEIIIFLAFSLCKAKH
ncbi:hypothetical protein XENOCAPTIV_008910, partial [Xenoophorus captivus]